MTAPCWKQPRARGPSFESLQGRNPREFEVGRCRALWRFERSDERRGKAREPGRWVIAPVGAAEIIADFEKVYAESPIMYVVEVHERLAPDPLAALRAGFEWSELSIYDLAGPTGRHGVLLGTRRWRALAVGVLPHADGWLKDTGWRGQGRA